MTLSQWMILSKNLEYFFILSKVSSRFKDNYNSLLILITQLDCRLAMVRIKEDKPITIKDDKGDSRKLIAQIVSVLKITTKKE